MDLKKKLYLLIDAGGTYFKSVIANENAEITTGSAFQIESHSEGPADKIINAYREVITRGLACIEKNEGSLGGIGICTPGPFDYEKGIPLMKHKFASIYGLNLPDSFRAIPGVKPDIPICAMHDTTAALAGEYLLGYAKGYANVALVTLGTGLGFAYSQNGEIQYNMEGGPRISAYKLPYGNGILEDYASRRGILGMYERKSGKSVENMDVSDIGGWANQGESTSIDVFNELGTILTENLYDILDEQSIQCLLFGGQISRSFPHMEKSLINGLSNIKSLEKISRVKNIDDAALFGVLWEILNN